MNKNFWNLYKDSKKGKEVIDLFTFDSENDDLELKAKQIFQKYNEYFGGPDVEDYFLDNCCLVIDNIIASKLFIEDGESNTEYFIKLIDHLEIFLLKKIHRES